MNMPVSNAHAVSNGDISGSSNVSPDSIRSLPTPEMSPIERDQEGFMFQKEGVAREGNENPVSQLINRFSDSSKFLRNVRPPFPARGSQPPPNGFTLRDLVANSSNYSLQQYSLSSDMMSTEQHQGVVKIQEPDERSSCNYSYAVTDVKPPRPLPSYPYAAPSYQNAVYYQQTRFQQEGESGYFPDQAYPENECIDDVDRNEFEKYLKGTFNNQQQVLSQQQYSQTYQCSEGSSFETHGDSSGTNTDKSFLGLPMDSSVEDVPTFARPSSGTTNISSIYGTSGSPTKSENSGLIAALSEARQIML